MKYEHKILVTQSLSSAFMDRDKVAQRIAAAERKLDKLSRARWQIVAVNTVRNSSLAYTLRRPV